MVHTKPFQHPPISTNPAIATPNAITMPASVTRSETDTTLSPKQIQQRNQGVLIDTTPEMDASIERIERHEREKKASPTNGPPKKVHRLLTRRVDVASIPKTDRVTRSMRVKRAPPPEPIANGKGSDDASSRIKRINCRFRIPGTDNIEYWRGGKKMICPPGFKPWER
ncbi:MAG: hypothetical protein Q9196_000591 [Gyalolechia fulgens]